MKKLILIGLIIAVCGLTACRETTADHVLKATQAVDYENMTFAEIIEAAIGCSEETSGDIAEILHASGVIEITEIKRYDSSTKDKIGGWIIDTDQTKIQLDLGSTENDLSLVLDQWPELSLTGDQELHFADASGFQIFGPDSEGLQLIVRDQGGTRGITIRDNDFIQPWVICYQGEQLYYLNIVKIMAVNQDYKLTSLESPFVLIANQDGETSLKIDNKEVPVTDQFSSFGNGARLPVIQFQDNDISISE